MFTIPWLLIQSELVKIRPRQDSLVLPSLVAPLINWLSPNSFVTEFSSLYSLVFFFVKINIKISHKKNISISLNVSSVNPL